MPEPWFPLPMALAPPKEKTEKTGSTMPLPVFALELLETDKLKMKLGLDRAYSAFENLRGLYKGMLAGEKSGETGTLGIKYFLNNGITKSQSEVLATRKRRLRRNNAAGISFCLRTGSAKRSHG